MRSRERMQGLLLTITRQSKAFNELAAMFAGLDREEARKALAAVNDSTTTNLLKASNEFTKLGNRTEPLQLCEANMREMLAAAQQSIDQAAKPN